MSRSSSAVGADVRALADALVGLFERDRGLANELNVTQRRLLDANDRRRSAPARRVVSEDVRRACASLNPAARIASTSRAVASPTCAATSRRCSAVVKYSTNAWRNADVWALRLGCYREG